MHWLESPFSISAAPLIMRDVYFKYQVGTGLYMLDRWEEVLFNLTVLILVIGTLYAVGPDVMSFLRKEFEALSNEAIELYSNFKARAAQPEL